VQQGGNILIDFEARSQTKSVWIHVNSRSQKDGASHVGQRGLKARFGDRQNQKGHTHVSCEEAEDTAKKTSKNRKTIAEHGNKGGPFFEGRVQKHENRIFHEPSLGWGEGRRKEISKRESGYDRGGKGESLPRLGKIFLNGRLMGGNYDPEY